MSNSLLLPAEEAQEIEQKAHQAQLEREKHNWEKRSQTGRIMPGEQLSQKEMNDRLWAFMCVWTSCVLIASLTPRTQELQTHRFRRRGDG